MFKRTPTLIDNHVARALLEEKYPKGQPPHGFMFNAHLATFGAYGWRQTFHRLTEGEITSHDVKGSCEICLTAAELCALHSVPLINLRIIACIRTALSPEHYGQGHGKSADWLEAVEHLPLEIAMAIEDQLHMRLDWPLNNSEEPCEICIAAGNAVTANWMSGSTDNIMGLNNHIIQGVFGWSCPFPHGGD